MKTKIFLLSLATLLLVACQKETKIQRDLWKKGGTWTVVQSETTKTTPLNGTNTTVENFAGQFVFLKNGTGTWTYQGIIDGGWTEEDREGTIEKNFNYSNTETELNLIMEGKSNIYDIEWSKGKMNLSRTLEYETDAEGYIIQTELMTLEKVK